MGVFSSSFLIKGTRVLVLLLLWCSSLETRGDEVIFADNFDAGLAREWNVSGLRKDDYRIREGGLELRVHPGKVSDDTPMLTFALPVGATDGLVASVEVTVLDRFTEPAELAGLFLATEGKLEFGAKKQLVDGRLVFSPGKPEFIGQSGEEGDPDKYAVRYWPAAKESAPLRIVVRDAFAFFQVGPTAKGDYVTSFHSAIEKQPRQRGFALVAAGGPEKEAHWVRFDNFRVMRVK